MEEEDVLIVIHGMSFDTILLQCLQISISCQVVNSSVLLDPSNVPWQLLAGVPTGTCFMVQASIEETFVFSLGPHTEVSVFSYPDGYNHV